MLGLYLAAMDDSTYETQFVQVYERCKRLVYHTAYQIVQDSYLAEDVLQEVFCIWPKILHGCIGKISIKWRLTL